MELEMDTEWIHDFETYNDFYKEPITNINIKYIFLNKKGYIERIQQEPYLLSEQGKLKKEELLYILKKQLLHHNNKYSLLSMIKFNITIDNDEVIQLYNEHQDMSKDNNEDMNENINENINGVKKERIQFSDYITTIHSITDVVWDETINIFKDMNELLIIFIERKKQNTHTKKIYINNKNHKNKQKNNEHKRTRRNTKMKMLKDNLLL